MTDSQIVNSKSCQTQEESAAKVKLLLGDKEVPDPYYDDTQFEPVFELIELGCKDFIKKALGLKS